MNKWTARSFRLLPGQAIPGYVLLLMPVIYGITGQSPFNTEITPYFSCELSVLVGYLRRCHDWVNRYSMRVRVCS